MVQENLFVGSPDAASASLAVDLEWTALRVVIYDVCAAFGPQDQDVLATATFSLDDIAGNAQSVVLADAHKISFADVLKSPSTKLRKRYFGAESGVKAPCMKILVE
jgi:hypothetical protein